MQRTSTGALLRANQAWYEQIAERVTLSDGIAFYSSRFPALADTNQFREVIADTPEGVARAFDEAEAFYAGKGLTCRRWCPVEGAFVDALDAYLIARGFARRTYDVWTLTQWPQIEKDDSVRVLPARAMRPAFRETFVPRPSSDADPTAAPPPAPQPAPQPAPSGGAASAAAVQTQAAEALEDRMADSHLDMFVATVDGHPAGRGGLYQAGDIGCVKGLHVLAGVPSQEKVAMALLAQLTALAHRLALPNVVMQAPAGDTPYQACLRAGGFETDGQIVEYERE